MEFTSENLNAATAGVKQTPLKTVASDPEFGTSTSTATTACEAEECFDEEIVVVSNVLRLQCEAHQIPHPDKVEYGGEDAYFICSDGTAAGVADGVSEWGWRFGLNPRHFASEVMEGARLSAESTKDGTLDAQGKAAKSLSDGFAAGKSFGAATALTVSLSSEGTRLGVANLGDSGLRLLRRSDGEDSVRVIYRTVEQQHAFSKPFQLSRIPRPEEYQALVEAGKSTLVRAVRRIGQLQQDLPEHALQSVLSVQEGDVLILGSDGLFDNLSDEDLCKIVNQMEGHELAKTLAEAASKMSTDTTAETPISVKAKESGIAHSGGVLDDITVLVARVEKGNH